MSEARLAIYLEHIKPAIDWLENQSGKKFIIKITNLSEKVSEKNLEKYLNNTFRKEPLSYQKIVIERDAQNYSKGIAWITSDHKPTLSKILRLHEKVI